MSGLTHRVVLASLLAVSTVAAWGQDAVRPAAPAAAPAETPGDYPVGPKDLLEVRVLELPEMNVERRVTDAGTIDLPMLGDFSVSGLTASQVRDKLERMLTEKYVNRANVSIVVKDYGNKPISVLGAVNKTGSLNVSGSWTLLQAISAAGGLTERAGKTIYVLRRSENGLSDTLEIDVNGLLHGGSPKWNIPLYPGDIVNVEGRRSVRIFCLGAVRSPGALDLDEGDRLTLLSVIARAGGLTDKAASKIRIKRRGADGKDSEIFVNYARIVSGKDPDPPIQADDVVIVKESFF
jgi:polysaccharide export outer membrane protein